MGKGRLILGGTFNPLHIGHLRLAIGASEMLSDFVDQVDFVPAFFPPHKRMRGVLPFSTRVDIIKTVIRDIPNFYCNDLESSRPGPSYTYDTLKLYNKLYESENLYFLIGSPDFELLATWHKGLELVKFANLIIVPRGTFRTEDFLNTIKQFWNEDKFEQIKFNARLCNKGESLCVSLPNAKSIYYLPLPFLDISSSLIRELWLAGKSIAYLVPDVEAVILEKRKKYIAECWQENICSK